MKREKDIRAFMQEHRFEVSGDDGFMDDFVRQIDLLPESAAFEKVDRQVIREKLDLMSRTYAALRRLNLCKAGVAAVLIVVLCSLSISAISLVPESVLASCREALDGFMGTAKVAVPLGSGLSGDFRLSLETLYVSVPILFYGIVVLLCIVFSAIAGKRIFSLK